jgi:hypothetical protein
MISSRRSGELRKNPALVEMREPKTRPTVLSCVKDVMPAGESPDGTLVLLGGTDLLHFHLRVAQSHVRHDMTPSSWSHAGMVMRDGKKLVIQEVALDPAGGFTDMPASNGIHAVPISHYDDPTRFPNLAVLRFPLAARPGEGVPEAIAKVQRERGILDLTALILPWLGYAWGAGLPTNPLLSGTGIPSAAFVEAVFAALGLELTPGLATRASCPEAIWQAARWWHRFYEGPTIDKQSAKDHARRPHGCYWIGQKQACLHGG